MSAPPEDPQNRVLLPAELMIDNEHTPGPWRAVTGNAVFAGDDPIASVYRAKDAKPRRAFCVTPQQQANARLLAAAPDMLNELERLIWVARNTPDRIHKYILSPASPVRAVIAKAKGGPS